MAAERNPVAVRGAESQLWSPIRLLICSKHRVLRAALRLLVETDTKNTVIAEADSASAILTLADSTGADVILVDDDLYGTLPHTLWTVLRLSVPSARVLLLHDERPDNSAQQLGLVLISKGDAPEALLEAIHKVGSGEPLPSESSHSDLSSSSVRQPYVYLTRDDSIESLPTGDPPIHRKTISDKRVLTVLETVENDLQQSHSVEFLARRVGIGGSRLRHLLRDLIGVSLSQFRNERRLQVAAQLLAYSHKRVSEIAYQVGFSDLAYFDKAFRKRFGLSPTRYRRSNSQVGRPIPGSVVT